ncbi:MAG: hypothetical protein CMG57_06450 [Candidatus Marinimicrobia bacterium]|nr:hypothetical protein [Candidatus Neomarinimicrobiota bacterium]
MKRVFYINSMMAALVIAQPKETIEFQLNTISGIVLNKKDQTPIPDLKVEILSGNNLLKDSTFTDDDGNFMIEEVGYVWKPKIRFFSRDFESITHKLNPKQLDKNNNITIRQLVSPIPNNKKIPSLTQNAIESRAETFFIRGNVFYYLSIVNNRYFAERIIIRSKQAHDKGDGFIDIVVNGITYDPARCYVPQIGKYENLAHIIDDYFPSPIFARSGLPLHLPKDLLEPSTIYGAVKDAITGKAVPGVEVRLAGSSKRRITDQKGKFAFQVKEAGTYRIMVNPPLGYTKNESGISQIMVKSSRGGWYLSNHFVSR